MVSQHDTIAIVVVAVGVINVAVVVVVGVSGGSSDIITADVFRARGNFRYTHKKPQSVPQITLITRVHPPIITHTRHTPTHTPHTHTLHTTYIHTNIHANIW